jgi:hypothetical protein
MFEALRARRDGSQGIVHDAGGEMVAEGGVDDRRGSERFHFAGAEVFLFTPDDQCFRLRLKDVSLSGISGLTDAPVSIGELVMVQFEETFMPAALVSWTRNATIGLEMVNPMPPSRLARLAERHEQGAAWSPAMRAGSDLGGWWTDVDAVKSGRQARPAKASRRR